MTAKPKVLVLISGRGSNLKSLIDNASDYSVGAVLSNKPEAPGLQHATGNGIETHVVERSDFASLKAHKAAIYERIAEINADYIALAGFMMILDEQFVQSVYGKLINIHPSLLPSYPGLDTHERLIASADIRHGCTVHFVDKGVDTGPIILQAVCDRVAEDSVESISAKVLKLEHQLYPWAMNAVARGDIWLDSSGTVQFRNGAAAAASQLGFRTAAAE